MRSTQTRNSVRLFAHAFGIIARKATPSLGLVTASVSCIRKSMKRKFQFSYTFFLLICLTIFHTIGDWRVFGVGVSSLFLLLSPLISVPLIFFNVYLAYKAKIFTTYNAVLTFFNVIYVAYYVFFLLPVFMAI